jgi:hypothetical protein
LTDRNKTNKLKLKKANAEAQLAKAKKAGFTDAFIKYD